MLKTKEKEKVLKAAIDKNILAIGEKQISHQKPQDPKGSTQYFPSAERKELSTWNCKSSENIFTNEGEINTFSDE